MVGRTTEEGKGEKPPRQIEPSAKPPWEDIHMMLPDLGSPCRADRPSKSLHQEPNKNHPDQIYQLRPVTTRV